MRITTRRGAWAPLVIVAALFCAAGAAKAEPIVWTATKADKDGYGKYGGGHAFWLPGFVKNESGTSKFVFETSGVFTEAMDKKTATLTGAIQADGNAAYGFNAVVNFDNPSGFSPAAKLELIPDAYTPGSGGVNPLDWNFYRFVADVALTGTGSFSGLNLVLSHKPANDAMGFQVGVGANGKNIGTGASGWFYYTIDTASSSASWIADWGQTGMQYGDINIDLTATPPQTNVVPEPGSVALMGVAFAGVLVWRRKRQRA